MLRASHVTCWDILLILIGEVGNKNSGCKIINSNGSTQNKMSVGDTETGWDLVPFPAVLDLDRCLFQQRNAKKCTREETPCMCVEHACGLNHKIQKDQDKQTNKPLLLLKNQE